MTHWIRTVFSRPSIRLSQIVEPTDSKNELFAFPSKATLEQLTASEVYDLKLAGFERNGGQGSRFTFVLSNGIKTTGRDGGQSYAAHMMPHGMVTKKVQIYHSGNIFGFKFLDKWDVATFEIGYTASWFTVTEVALQDNEQIIGVQYRLHATYQTVYTDFQFQIA